MGIRLFGIRFTFGAFIWRTRIAPAPEPPSEPMETSVSSVDDQESSLSRLSEEESTQVMPFDENVMYEGEDLRPLGFQERVAEDPRSVEQFNARIDRMQKMMDDVESRTLLIFSETTGEITDNADVVVKQRMRECMTEHVR